MAAGVAWQPRALVVDDDERVLGLHARALRKAGFEVETAVDGDTAMSVLRRASFDVVLSDIDMPGMDGIRLLEQVRSHDVDVPVVLITGAPSIETAVQALDRGALRYLPKPISLADLVKVALDAVRLHRLAVAKRQALALIDHGNYFAGDQAGLAVTFDRALASMRWAYQPIVSLSTQSVVAYESLLRSTEPALPTPGAMLNAADRLGRIHDLGRRARAIAVEPLAVLPPGVGMFCNLHPVDLLDDDLLSGTTAFSAAASLITLEITERMPLDGITDVRSRLRRLRELGFRLALDDFGAGFGGLTSFALMEPEVVKIDMELVRDIEQERTKQSLVRTIVQMCGELGIAVIAEGVETPGERDELGRVGCDLMQGYLFAHPADPPPAPVF